MKKLLDPALRKNLILLIKAFAFCMVLFVASCQNEEIYLQQDQATTAANVKQLKDWYDQNSKVALPDNWLNGLTPNWEKVKKLKSKKQYVYEIEINNPDEIFATINTVDNNHPQNFFYRNQERLQTYC